MSGLEWILAATLFSFYIFFIFTVCSMTFAKGYTVLGIVGIFIPFLWLIGAILPAKRGSRVDIAEQMQYQRNVGQMTQ